jgi:hypothetical protein
LSVKCAYRDVVAVRTRPGKVVLGAGSLLLWLSRHVLV